MEDKKAELYRCGRELFGSKGFKDTNIADITKMAGVSVGTFYNYYPSKEKLFMEIYLAENEALKRRMMTVVDPNDEPLPFIKKMMAFNYEGIRSNPILCQWYNKDVYDKLERLFKEENGMGVAEMYQKEEKALIQAWQAEGKIRNDIKSEMIIAMFTAIVNIDLHKEEIGLQYFPELQDYLTDFVLKGLTDWPKG
ncbi:TetR/AcrR family transcriptional regulator [Paenibacillus sp. YN15]|uniref:TetR/AcrR family transcriptional regulator n=1 Tax=Paenibacillus sp. YN15 TaxID=1742774 RepID=UPI000DCD037D|nr:TetR/AcrR family transcriptional regulator [Paenibacillus sp. YN15]RAU91594.1 TetR/AcrR family transcriptional regulator [Paenibacillus sp. YN15]